jgi:predicted house-cleaning noncanonical NTP pyrophosphatase (MazG superfamily)
MPKADSKPRLVKLVRDRIGRHLGSSQVTYTRIEDRQEFLDALKAKMLEEYLEYLIKPGVDELADMLQVMRDLAEEHLQVPFSQVEVRRQEKFADRGGFFGQMGMYVQTTAKKHG